MFTGLAAGFLAVTSVVASPMPINDISSLDTLDTFDTFEKRSTNDVIAAIHEISDKLTELNNTATDYVGGIKGATKAIKIQILSKKVLKALEKATDATNDIEEPKIGLGPSLDISVNMLQLLPRITSTLDTLVSKADEFAKGVLGTGLVPLNGIVRKSLEDQQEKANEFSEALIPKLEEIFATVAPLITNTINNSFNRAIEVFSEEK